LTAPQLNFQNKAKPSQNDDSTSLGNILWPDTVRNFICSITTTKKQQVIRAVCIVIYYMLIAHLAYVVPKSIVLIIQLN